MNRIEHYLKTVNIPQPLEKFVLNLEVKSIVQLCTISDLLRDECGNGNALIIDKETFPNYISCTIFFKTTNQRFPTICKLIKSVLNINEKGYFILTSGKQKRYRYDLDAKVMRGF